MVIDTGTMPKYIRSFSFSPRMILSENENILFLIRMKELIFGKKCCEDVGKIGIDLFDLVFVNEKPFRDCFDERKCSEENSDEIKTAFMLKKLYKCENVRVARVRVEGDLAFVEEPEPVTAGAGSLPEKDIKKPLNKRAVIMLESIRLAALRFTMKKCMDYKRLADEYNYGRFTKGLRLNNRPAPLEDIKAAMAVRKGKLFGDLSRDKTRINFSILYALAFGGYTMDDIYSRAGVFGSDADKKRKSLADLSGDLLTILYNGNGVEISNMLINMIVSFSQLPLPPVDLKDLSNIVTYYPVYYTITNLASVLEGIFAADKNSGSQMKEYMK